MENLLLLLPDRPQSVVVRYLLTTLIVGICFLLQVGVEMQSGFFGFFLLLPGIFIASLIFDRGSGFYATVLSTALSVLVLMRPGGGFGLLSQHLVPLVLFLLIGLGLATVSEGLRKALERAVRAERVKDLALSELNHRIRNDLAMMASVLELQTRAQTDPGAKAAFRSAVGRIHVIANAHDHLLPRDDQSSIDMKEYLTDCCRHLADTLRDVRPIAVNVEADPVYLPSDKAVPVGLMVNELATNAFKYAFPDDRAGTITVRFRNRSARELELVVEDNGKGCPQGAKEGLGSRIVRLLAQQLKGDVTTESAGPGCRKIIAFPAGER
ncbi:MAG TPA: histidine kinase dimerization/phosphoacceptor domain -containing protein [Sphingomicrobium sp.]|nr:histidine kinase dimerization/phosphoacceptor domain -containing protein [Sphingomicrobium sp.]